MSDSESATSDDEEPEVRVHFEIHLQEDADSEPICPLSDRNLTTLVEELDLTIQERTEVEKIQTKEELATYFEKLPRDYDVQIIFTDRTPECKSVLSVRNQCSSVAFGGGPHLLNIDFLANQLAFFSTGSHVCTGRYRLEWRVHCDCQKGIRFVSPRKKESTEETTL